MRRPDNARQNVILFTDRATSDDLTRAVAVLGALRARDGDHVTKAITVVPSANLIASKSLEVERDKLQSVLDLFHAAPLTDLPGVGLARLWRYHLGASPTLRQRQ